MNGWYCSAASASQMAARMSRSRRPASGVIMAPR
jgi:hypothetical protein